MSNAFGKIAATSWKRVTNLWRLGKGSQIVELFRQKARLVIFVPSLRVRLRHRGRFPLCSFLLLAATLSVRFHKAIKIIFSHEKRQDRVPPGRRGHSPLLQKEREIWHRTGERATNERTIYCARRRAPLCCQRDARIKRNDSLFVKIDILFPLFLLLFKVFFSNQSSCFVVPRRVQVTCESNRQQESRSIVRPRRHSLLSFFGDNYTFSLPLPFINLPIERIILILFRITDDILQPLILRT